jgi:hypothetical protein
MSGSVTAAQRDVFLEAYRNTFSVENHGKELKMLYLNFAERFVVDADVLRGIVQEDLAENKELYAKLRNALAARRGPVKPKPKVEKPAAAKKPRSKSDAAVEPKKKKKKNAEKSAGKVVTRSPRIGRGPAVKCRICGQNVHTNRNGTMALHNAPGTFGQVPCPGAGLKVAPPKTNAKRPDDRSDSRSIRTVTSGLGSLGKR